MSSFNNKNNMFLEGTVVYAKNNLQLALCIRRYVNDIYYCQITSDPNRKELVYFERELTAKNEVNTQFDKNIRVNNVTIENSSVR
jgi:hypothetical protein